jgi:hypothetical protein
VRLTALVGVNVQVAGPPVMFHTEPEQPGVLAAPVPVALSEKTPDTAVSVALVIPMVPAFCGVVELLVMLSEDATPVAPTVTAPPIVGMLGSMLMAVPASATLGARGVAAGLTTTGRAEPRRLVVRARTTPG